MSFYRNEIVKACAEYERIGERTMVYKIREPKAAAPFFAGWEETIIWSCLAGAMGAVYGDSEEKPESVMALLGDFCFFAGKPHRELVSFQPEENRRDFVIMAFPDESWAELIEACYGERAKRRERYALKKEGDIFDRERLKETAASLPPGYTVRLLDEEMFCRCLEMPWCRDLAAQYSGYGEYENHGLGVVILKDGEIVSGASSYSWYPGGIEIEIDTREDFRRRGLGLVCGAKLILECLERGWYPSWDAQNRQSLRLAERLGYHFDRAYPVYEVFRQERTEKN